MSAPWQTVFLDSANTSNAVLALDHVMGRYSILLRTIDFNKTVLFYGQPSTMHPFVARDIAPSVLLLY